MSVFDWIVPVAIIFVDYDLVALMFLNDEMIAVAEHMSEEAGPETGQPSLLSLKHTYELPNLH